MKKEISLGYAVKNSYTSLKLEQKKTSERKTEPNRNEERNESVGNEAFY